MLGRFYDIGRVRVGHIPDERSHYRLRSSVEEGSRSVRPHSMWWLLSGREVIEHLVNVFIDVLGVLFRVF